ncbi:hypothetical protein, variant [Verruconis gallopava]|uniref:Autophagy-related protein n=1 Tax=Verruconis gallopava TaxID=253628 RepID=A0A0D2AKU8_9PEZI|nr:hypothetical protein, variant [Verruconis gallopava]KIW07428.1 hypothetical protein, variant [Verruconis gallopava]
METETGRHRRPRYVGEDTSATTQRELRGWYSYAVAAEVFAVVGLGSFLPITLEQLARENGVLKSDRVTSCVAGTSSNVAPAAAAAAKRADQQDAPCVVNVLGAFVNTSSFVLYTSSLAVGVQALVLISISAIADHGNYRKRFLLTLAWTGATASMLFIFVSPGVYLFAPLLVILAVCCLGNSFALLNSFLPLLVANHPSSPATASDPALDRSWLPVAPSELEPPVVVLAADHSLPLANAISARATAAGYAAAVLVQVVSIGMLVLMAKLGLNGSPSLPMRSVLFLVGAWWALFSIPTYLWLRPRPGPRLASVPITTRRWLQPAHYVAFAWRSLFRTFRSALRLRHVRLFLLAWFLVSDAVATISNVAILFARTELHMSTPAIALVSITATVSGIAGAALWPKIQTRLGLATNHTIMVCICMFEIIPLYGLLGFVLPVLGLRQPWEIFPMAFVHGFAMGGISSFCRAFYGVLVPPGSEVAFYAIYAVTDKGSSVIGPAIVGRIVDATGSVRMGFWFLAVLIVLPLPLVFWVDAESGRQDALRMARAADKGDTDDGEEAVALTRGPGRSTDEDEDETFGLADSDDDLEHIPNR